MSDTAGQSPDQETAPPRRGNLPIGLILIVASLLVSWLAFKIAKIWLADELAGTAGFVTYFVVFISAHRLLVARRPKTRGKAVGNSDSDE